MRSPDAAAPFPTESPRGRRWRRIMCWWLPGLFAAWVLIGFLGVPLIVKKWIVPKIGQRLNGSIAVRECSFNPFTWRLVLRGAAVTDAAGTKVLAAEEIDANIEPLRTIFRTGWHASWARADGPYVRAELSPDGKLNIVELIKPDPDPSPPIERIPRVVVDDVIVRAGEVRLADRTPGRPVDLAWTGLAFTLTGVDTRPDHDNRYRLEASNSEGEKLAWTGGFQVNPLSSDGQVTIEGLGLARFDPYVDLHARAKLVDGRLNAKATYQFDPVAGRIIAGVQATVTQVKLDREEGRWIDLPLVEIKDIRLDAVKRELTVGAVEVSGGTISTDRDEQGRWFIERILKEAKPTGSGGSLPTATAAATQDRVDPQSIPFSVVRLERALTQLISDARGQWTVALDKLNVSQLTFGFVDRSGRAPVRIDLTQLGLTAGPVRSAEQFRTPMKLNAVFGRGTIAVDADLEPAVPRTKLDVDLKEIDLVILGPYLPMRLMTDLPPVELRRGLATVKGELRGEVGADRKIATRWEGTTSVAGITLVPAAGGDPLASVTGVAHTGVLTGERSPDGRAVSTFSGRGTLTGLAGDVPLAGGLSGAVETLDFDGTATATMDGAAATIELKGKSKAVNFAGTGRSLMGGSSVRLGSAELEGQAQLRVSETFAAEAKGKATLNSARAEAKDLNGAAATAGAQGLFADGSVSVRGGGGTGDVELAGDLAGAKVVFDAGNLAGPVQGAADRLGVSGKASASLAGANSTGSAEGGLRAESLRFDGRELLGPIDGTIGAAALTGRIEKGADWLAGSGDVEINSTKLNAAKLGDGKLEWSQLRLEKASLDSRSKEARIEAVVVNGPKATANVAILPREAGTASAGAGTVALTPADLRHVRPVLERLSAYSLAIGRAEIDGGVLQARDDASKPPASLLVEDLKGV
ncbi:MAG: DUF748 domain-containing protein, partial [Phycisphaerales bacterium]